MKLLILTVEGKPLTVEQRKMKRDRIFEELNQWLKDVGLDSDYMPMVSTEPVDVQVVEL